MIFKLPVQIPIDPSFIEDCSNVDLAGLAMPLNSGFVLHFIEK